MKRHWVIMAFISVFFGGAFSFSLSFLLFNTAGHSSLDRLSLLLVPALAAAFLLPPMLFRGWETFKEGLPFSRLVLGVAAAGTAFFLVSALRPPMAVLWLLSWATAAGGIWLLLLPALRDANAFLIEERRGRWLLAWLLGSAAAFLSSGFLVNPYPHPLQRLFLAASLSLLWGAIAYYALGRLWRVLNWQGLLNLAILVLFLFGVFWIGQQHPILFDIEPFSLKGQQAALFFSGMFFAMPWLAALLYVLERNQLRWRNSPLIVFVEEHFFGLLLASLFFAIYLFLGSIFNHSLMSQNDDVLFDTDSRTWKLRLATDAWQDPYQRSVHPAVLLVLRLWVQTLVFLLNGKQVAAALFATAAAGATCVFLAWLFIKNASQDENYALTWASILGASAGHLIFGSLVETYIFLALLLLLFMVLLQKEHLPLRWLVVTGLLTFGITLTNIIQEMLALLAVRRDLRLAAKFTGLVLSLGVVLSLANNLIFAAANPLFFLPSAFESRHMFAINSERAKVLFKGFFLHSMIGPDPLIFPAPAEKGYPPAFRTYRPFLNQRAEYNPLSKVVAWIWLGVLLIGSLLFLRSRGKNFRFSIGFLLCLAFNFGLHLRYGREFLLYSPNWIYALVLFLALSWANLRRVWAQGALQGFLVLLLISNMHFLYLIIHTAAVLIQGGS